MVSRTGNAAMRFGNPSIDAIAPPARTIARAKIAEYPLIPTQAPIGEIAMVETNNAQELSEVEIKRRALLKKIGRFVAVSAPTVTLLLAATANPTKAVAY